MTEAAAFAERRDADIVFYGIGTQSHIKGSVLFRGTDEMVIDIEAQAESEYPYLIKGLKVNGQAYYAGKDSHRQNEGVSIVARWAMFGTDLYGGIWRENNEDFMFSFRLRPKSRNTT